MKPAPVGYHRATSTTDAVSALATIGAKVLAGGQTLVPLLAMRKARPSILVDINGLSDLDYVRRDGDRLAIGALTRHRTVETSPEVAMAAPLLAEAMRYVGHVTIRNRGTIGGSVAHSDPAAEVPAVLTALDAELVITGSGGVRTVGATEFFVDRFTSVLQPDELLTEIRVPILPAGTVVAVEELARRRGDLAIVAVFLAVTTDGAGRGTDARIAVSGAGAVPLRARAAEAALVGAELGGDTAGAAVDGAAAAVEAAADGPDDVHAPAGYRREMAAVLTRRALLRVLPSTIGASKRSPRSR
jgi:carbon-monoxide dehydrogenase medium subunit